MFRVRVNVGDLSPGQLTVSMCDGQLVVSALSGPRHVTKSFRLPDDVDTDRHAHSLTPPALHSHTPSSSDVFKDFERTCLLD